MRLRPYDKVLDAEPHSPVYTMHRYFARRPQNVFRELIRHYTRESDMVLDPFCGGGVTVVEGLLLRRRVIGVDINPLATYVTEMEVRPLDIHAFRHATNVLEADVHEFMQWLYETHCPDCECGKLLNVANAQIEWCEWEGERMSRIKYHCPAGHRGEKEPSDFDLEKAAEFESRFEEMVGRWKLWYPKVPIPPGDKTNSIIAKGYKFFHQLFTRRNLLALAMLHKRIQEVKDETLRDFLQFALSGSLKWASKQSHLRGDIVEGWAMHAYWIYPRWLEINVWQTFDKRCRAIERGKAQVQFLADYYRPAKAFEDFLRDATVMLWTGSADELPVPDCSIDCIITDPPYGGNVNYGELADYWLAWLRGRTMEKQKEAVINSVQGKKLEDYEALLHAIFRECRRVLKRDGVIVVTFNCKDLSIITAFLKAVVTAGFRLLDGGLIYQPPVKLYTTTFHAKEVGAFTGDFIFTFVNQPYLPTEVTRLTLERVDSIAESALKGSLVEVQARQKIYTDVIPLLAQSVLASDDTLYSLVQRIESRIRTHKFPPLHFSQARAIAR